MSARASLLPKYSLTTAFSGTVNAAVNLGSTVAYVALNKDSIEGAARVLPATFAVGGALVNTIGQTQHTLSVLNCNDNNEKKFKGGELAYA